MVVHCPGCNNRYVLDEGKIPPRGAILTCRQCGRTTRVAAPGAPPAPAAARPEASGAPAPRPAHDTSSALRQPLSCPKCGHLFVPETRPAAGPSPPTTGRQRPAAAATHILLVEDQNYFVEMTREALGEGYRTTVVPNLSEAARLLDGQRVDLVILDLSLEGGQDGTNLLRATRSQGIPVLIFTARDETELYGGAWEQLRAAGASDILIKGMNVGDELKQKVRSLVGRPQK